MLKRIIRGLIVTTIIAVVGFSIRFALYHPAEARALFEKAKSSAIEQCNKLPLNRLKELISQEKDVMALIPDDPTILETPQLFFDRDGLPVMLLPSQAKATAAAYAAIPTATPPAQRGIEAANVPNDAQPLNTEAQVAVIADSLRVRGGPGIDCDKVASVHKGDVLSVTEANDAGDWLHIHTDSGIDGWVSADYVQAVTESAPAIASLPTCIPPSPTLPPPTETPIPTATISFEPVNPPSHGTSTPNTGSTLTSNTAPLPATATPRPPVSAPAIRVPSPSYGLNVHLLGDEGTRRAALDKVQDVNFNWVKTQIRWLDYEGSAKGAYNWTWLDPIVADVNARGLKLMLSVVAAPEWARPAGDDFSINGVPENPQDLGDFLAALVGHYPGQIAAIEVWNEQNLAREVGGRLDVSKYVAMLKAAYTSVKGVNPNVMIVSGGLTPTGTNDGYTAIDDRQYLQQMILGGAANYANAIGAHPSGYNMPPDADWQNPPQDQCGGFGFPCSNPHPSWVFKATLEDYHNILAANGVNKQIWATEFGWAVCGLSQPGYEYCQDNTRWEQREWIHRAYQLVGELGWDWVGTMFVWNLNYAQVAPDSEMAAFSILDWDGNPTDAFEGLRGLR